MKRVVISCGPIPSKLDSVKFITNRFKGGLAFRTASELIDSEKYDVTIVKWENTAIPSGSLGNSNNAFHTSIVNVSDVMEYYKWFEDNATNYDAFIMAAAVANLMPSNPYEGKFPSHNYKVGEQFDIKFEIAPRAIDIIKKLNSRCCLIGYKLFDAKSDEELIDIAKHTLKDSKANIIFANTPSEAKNRKIAVMQDGATIPMDFEAHIRFMMRAIDTEYFSTVINTIEVSGDKLPQLERAKGIVKLFENTFNGFGTVAVKVDGYGMVTTSRGHTSRPVLVNSVDFETRTIKADGKATLNAPLLWKMLENNKCDYVVHRHFDDPLYKNVADCAEMSYEFPGTVDEIKIAKLKNYKSLKIGNHGNVVCYSFKDVDWSKYYEQFPTKYFGTPDIMYDMIKDILNDSNSETLEIGSNRDCICKVSLDTNVKAQTDGVENITYEELKGETGTEARKFDLILLRNSINYLSEYQLDLVVKALKPNGLIVANGFLKAPDIKVSSNEVAVKDRDLVHHYLFDGDQAYEHVFYSRGKFEYEQTGFDVKAYSDSSILITKQG